MEYRNLGNTGIKVSRICFGTLTLSPLQAYLPLHEGVKIMKYAVERGINFFDTAEIYNNYPYLRELLHQCRNVDLIITSKSYAVTGAEMQESIEKARLALDRDVIDLFLLHEQESALTLKGHQGALDYLATAKSKGLVRAIGISTHNIAGVQGAMVIPEIDVIHPLINYQGLGIKDGTKEEMLAAIKNAALFGKGIYLMKALGGGNLLHDADFALEFAFGIKEAAAVALGMRSREEIIYNTLAASGLSIPDKIRSAVSTKKRRLHIDSWCEGCGACVDACPQGALFINEEGKAQVREENCLLCSYCAAACPHFFIKVY